MIAQMKKKYPIILLFLVLYSKEAQTQTQELRGAWIATVINLDWPTKGGSPDKQQQELRFIFDKLQSCGINTVFFQIRCEADAFYPSEIEPWSFYLTGKQGLAPSPFWDPVLFAKEEAHKRGMELHLWLNPYRVIRSISSTYPKDSNHLSVKYPGWMLPVKNILLLNPGIPEGRTYFLKILEQLALKYQPDGIHLDDYFYPYEGISNEDAATFGKYGAGRTIHEWREDNINQMVKEISYLLSTEFPDIKWGISPFGIWKSGTPAGIVGLSGASVTYGNALKWLSEKWVDYIAPQLYWAIGGSQDFKSLSNWWSLQLNGRHLYPGIAAYKAEPSMTSLSSLYKPEEIPNQIIHLRDRSIPGWILFRAANLSQTATQGLAGHLTNQANKTLCLTPSMHWKRQDKPKPVTSGQVTVSQNGYLLRWQKSGYNPEKDVATRFYGIYEIPGDSIIPGRTPTLTNEKLLSLTSDTVFQLPLKPGREKSDFFITAISPNSIQSEPVSLLRQTTAVREFKPITLKLENPFPNPAREAVNLHYEVHTDQELSIHFYSITGQQLTTLVQKRKHEKGSYSLCYHMHTWLNPGVYLIILEGKEERIIKKWVSF
jgi:uncharacterized lipoprotein YddW (UPF0748 family)